MQMSAPTVVRDVYSGVGPAWSSGPAAAYERMAAAAVARLPATPGGWRVLDLGAGTGAVSRCIARAGGSPVALDPAHSMLRQARCDHADLDSSPLVCTVGEAERLPFNAGCFDAVIAAFSLSHLARPAVGLREVRRVLRPAGHLLSVSFGAETAHPAKTCVDAVAERYGFRPPTWYAHLKQLEAAMAPEALCALVAAVGLTATHVEEVQADTGVDTPHQLVRWRLGMAHLAPFVAGLSPGKRAQLVCEAQQALGPSPQPWRPTLVILSSRAPA